MKYMIASDIHGSGYYCEKLVNQFYKEKPDVLLLLGDILYHGPRNDLPKGYAPKKVIEQLNPLASQIICVQGNCDAYVDQMVLDFPLMTDYTLIPFKDRKIFMTHGHLYHRDHMPKLQPNDILLYGHTHVPMHKVVEGVLCLNPGSISIPKEDSYHSYMTIEDGVIRWKKLDGMEYDMLQL